MKQKGSISIAIAIVVMIAVVVVGYFVWSRRITRPTPAEIKTDEIISDWKTFKHTRFSLKYPPSTNINSGSMGMELNEADAISVDGEKSLFGIGGAQTPLLKDDSSFNPEHEDPDLAKKWDIKTFSEKVWQLNKKEPNPELIPDHSVSDLEKTTVGGKDAYMFSVTGSYIDYTEEGLLGGETIFVFVADGDGTRYKISYPSNNEQSKLILQSLRFTR